MNGIDVVNMLCANGAAENAEEAVSRATWIINVDDRDDTYRVSTTETQPAKAKMLFIFSTEIKISSSSLLVPRVGESR